MMYSNKLVCSVKVGNKILRETFQNNQALVFIPFGSEYSLLLKNLGGRNAVVHIEIDGRKVCEGGFYIHAGAAVNIERFVQNYTEGRRFKFIEKTDEISNHRGDRIDDGMIRVTWQFEKPLPEVREVEVRHIHRRYHHWGCQCWECQPYVRWYYSPTITTYNSGSAIGSSSSTASGGGSTQTSCYSAQNISSQNVNFVKSAEQPGNDAGITVEGSKSFQQFHETTARALESNVHSMVIILKGRTAVIGAGPGPKVVKPYVVQKKTCTSCGRKSKGEFCSNCGTALKH